MVRTLFFLSMVDGAGFACLTKYEGVRNYMFKPVPVGDRIRYSYARINEVLPMPHLIDIQRKSYEWFIKEGLCEIFHDISPIKDFTGNLELSFENFELGKPIKIPVKSRNLPFSWVISR